MLARLKFDIPDLIQDILSHIPKDKIINGSFLDPAVGGGQFVRVIEQIKRDAGKTEEEIRNTVFGFEANLLRMTYARNKNKLVGTYTVDDLLIQDLPMKFDVIIGNPPYQAPKKGDYSYWARFVNKSHKLLKEDGYMAMIIPAGWMSPTNDIRQGQKSVMRDIFAKENTFYINIDPDLGKTYFPNVGQLFTWFVLNKGKYKKTKLDLGSKIVDIDISTMPMLAKSTDEINVGIIKKITATNPKWSFTRYIMTETWDDVKFEKSNVYAFPRINGNSNHLEKVGYTEAACRFQYNKKVVLPYNGSFYKFVVDNGIVGCTNAYVMLLEDNVNIKSAETYFNSKLIAWLGKNKFTQYNEGALINSVSAMDLTTDITEDDIFNFYKFTDVERKYINDHA